MAGPKHDPGLESRLQHLRDGLHSGQEPELEDGEDSPGHELAVQARVDSVQLAKARKSGGSGGKAGHGDKLHPVKGDRASLPPAGAKSRFGEGDKAPSSGLGSITRKIRSSIGMSRKDKAEAGEELGPPSHVQFEGVEHIPTPQAEHRDASP